MYGKLTRFSILACISIFIVFTSSTSKASLSNEAVNELDLELTASLGNLNIDIAVLFASFVSKFKGVPDAIGIGAHALEIGKSFEEGAENYAAAVPELRPQDNANFHKALDLAIELQLGTKGNPTSVFPYHVSNTTQLTKIKRDVRQLMGQDNFNMFGWAAISKAVEAEIEKRGLKAW